MRAKSTIKTKSKTKAKAQTIDNYLAALSNEKRAALERVRKTIRAAVPGSEECISYGIPAFRFEGKPFIWFGAAANHCALYGVVGKEFKDELADYDTSGRGTIRFQPDNPLPATLIGKLVKARVARNASKQRHAPDRD